jgi:hypothetical protein
MDFLTRRALHEDRFETRTAFMPSLRQLAAQADAEDALNNLEKRVVLQQAALDQAITDLHAARARQGVPDVDLPDVPDAPLDTDRVRALADAILRAGKRRRGELALDERSISSRAINQRVDNPAETSAFILAAARKAKT